MKSRIALPVVAASVALGVLAGCALGDPAGSVSPVAGAGAAPRTSSPSGRSASPSGSPTASPTLRSSATAAATPGKPLDKQALQSDLDGWREDMNVPGIMVGVWTPDDSWIGTTGVAGLNGGPITPRDHFRIGSLTKTFTATLLLALVDQHLVGLDDRIDKYLDGIPNGDATLRQAAEMRTGIVDYTGMGFFGDAVEHDRAKHWTTAELLDAVRRSGTYFPAGQGFSYSNSNAVILGAVAEKVTGQPMDVLLRRYVLAPLRLNGTGYPTTAALPSPYLSGATDWGDLTAPVVDGTSAEPSSLGPAGAMYATMEDLHVWAEALATNNPVLSPATQAMRLDSLKRPDGVLGRYGIGFDVDRGWIGHLGEISGYTVVMRYNPARHTTIVVVVNSNVYFEEARPADVTFSALLRSLGWPQG